MDMIKKIIEIEITKGDISESENSLTAVVSTEDRDRDNEIIRLGGMDLENYRKAGMPLLYQHRPEWLLAKGFWIKVHDKKLIGKWRFHMKNDLSRETYSLVKDGYLKQFSVGFISKGKTKTGIHLKSELLEASIVTLASNVNTDVLETKVHHPILRKELNLEAPGPEYRPVNFDTGLSNEKLQEIAKTGILKALDNLKEQVSGDGKKEKLIEIEKEDKEIEISIKDLKLIFTKRIRENPEQAGKIIARALEINEKLGKELLNETVEYNNIIELAKISGKVM